MKAKVRTSTSTAIDFNGTVFKVWYCTQEYADTMTCRFCSGLSEIGDVGCKCVSRSLKSDVVCDRVHCTDLGVNENYKNDREQTGSNVKSETNSRFVFISWQPGNVLNKDACYYGVVLHPFHFMEQFSFMQETATSDMTYITCQLRERSPMRHA